jgi:hypothetical protein
MSAPGLEHLSGAVLPEGSFTITADENRRLSSLLGAEPDADGLAHPLYGYVAAQRGIGIDVEGLLAMADFPIADGPMLGSCRLEYERPLRVGVPYRVTGEIAGIERKSGRKAGTFDVLTVRETLTEPDGARAAAVANVFILPRRAA